MVVGIGWSEGGHLVGGREGVSVDGVVGRVFGVVRVGGDLHRSRRWTSVSKYYNM